MRNSFLNLNVILNGSQKEIFECNTHKCKSSTNKPLLNAHYPSVSSHAHFAPQHFSWGLANLLPRESCLFFLYYSKVHARLHIIPSK